VRSRYWLLLKRSKQRRTLNNRRSVSIIPRLATCSSPAYRSTVIGFPLQREVIFACKPRLVQNCPPQHARKRPHQRGHGYPLSL
jgi:hypothetical protein